MHQLREYINEVLGCDTHPERVPKNALGKLPMFITEGYMFYEITLFGRAVILAEQKNSDEFSVLQIERNFNQIRQELQNKVALIAESITAINRKRLIEKGINFIVPGKQLYLPDLLIDLRETFPAKIIRKEKLLPSAQFILLYHLLHRNERIEQYPLKKLAEKFGYTQMAITKAVENLKYHELCTVEGSREKFVHFPGPAADLWKTAEPLLVNPVLKTVYVDEWPDVNMLHSNIIALAEYSDINRSRQEYYAIEKSVFYYLQKEGRLKNLNSQEGAYCIEVWKYNPEILAEGVRGPRDVDPLSLYLSLKDSRDERIEMALEKIIERYIW